jgi:hypothetical protein
MMPLPDWHAGGSEDGVILSSHSANFRSHTSLLNPENYLPSVNPFLSVIVEPAFSGVSLVYGHSGIIVVVYGYSAIILLLYRGIHVL